MDRFNRDECKDKSQFCSSCAILYFPTVSYLAFSRLSAHRVRRCAATPTPVTLKRQYSALLDGKTVQELEKHGLFI